MNVDDVLRETALQWDRMVGEQSDCNLDARFSALVERQSRLLFRVVYTVLRNPNDAEDVVQEAFLKVLKNGSWLKMLDERAFLARVAWRIALNRKSRGRATPPVQELQASTPETDVIAAEETRRMHALIDGLPEKLRQPLTLFALEELSTAEIAAILEEPEGTIRRRVAEARGLLRQKWERMNSNAR
jgi:RNA polymerase sigma-70 factor, ECF subfamily